MTFTDMITSCAATTSTCHKSGVTIGQALEKCLWRALASQRVTVGVQECAKLLGCAPERVMICLIPDLAGSADVGLHIQHTLVRSFCWENDIRLLAVKDTDKLRSIFVEACATSSASNGKNQPTAQQPEPQDSTQHTPAVGCMLIELPSGADLGPDEEFVCNYHDTIIYSDVYPQPVIQLPV